MAKVIYRGIIGPDDPIWTEGWKLSNPKRQIEPKPIKHKPKQQQKKKVRSSGIGGGESPLFWICIYGTKD